MSNMLGKLHDSSEYLKTSIFSFFLDESIMKP